MSQTDFIGAVFVADPANSARQLGVNSAGAITVDGGTIGASGTVAQTNYIGVVFVADPTNPSRQLKVNADGSINITEA